MKFKYFIWQILYKFNTVCSFIICDICSLSYFIYEVMYRISFECHGSTADSRELVVHVGQIAAFGTVGYYGFTMSEETKKQPSFQALFSWFDTFFLLSQDICCGSANRHFFKSIFLQSEKPSRQANIPYREPSVFCALTQRSISSRISSGSSRFSAHHLK